MRVVRRSKRTRAPHNPVRPPHLHLLRRLARRHPLLLGGLVDDHAGWAVDTSAEPINKHN